MSLAKSLSTSWPIYKFFKSIFLFFVPAAKYDDPSSTIAANRTSDILASPPRDDFVEGLSARDVEKQRRKLEKELKLRQKEIERRKIKDEKKRVKEAEKAEKEKIQADRKKDKSKLKANSIQVPLQCVIVLL